jgi:hypothetical protein
MVPELDHGFVCGRRHFDVCPQPLLSADEVATADFPAPFCISWLRIWTAVKAFYGVTMATRLNRAHALTFG